MFKTYKQKKRNAVKLTFLPFYNHAADRNRTGTGITTHGILSPGRLPVPPLQWTQAYNPRYIQYFTIHKLYTRGIISYIIRRILHFYCPYYTTNIFLSYFFFVEMNSHLRLVRRSCCKQRQV